MLERAITITGGGALGATRGLGSLGARHYSCGRQVRGGRDVNLTNTSIDSCRVSSCCQEGGRPRRSSLLATGVQTVLQTSARECDPPRHHLHTLPPYTKDATGSCGLDEERLAPAEAPPVLSSTATSPPILTSSVTVLPCQRCARGGVSDGDVDIVVHDKGNKEANGAGDVSPSTGRNRRS